MFRAGPGGRRACRNWRLKSGIGMRAEMTPAPWLRCTGERCRGHRVLPYLPGAGPSPEGDEDAAATWLATQGRKGRGRWKCIETRPWGRCSGEARDGRRNRLRKPGDPSQRQASREPQSGARPAAPESSGTAGSFPATKRRASPHTGTRDANRCLPNGPPSGTLSGGAENLCTGPAESQFQPGQGSRAARQARMNAQGERSLG